MKKIFCILITALCLYINFALCASNALIKGGIALTEELPEELHGSWRVESECIKCTNKDMFEPSSIDIWTFERIGNTVILSNPESGARAGININSVKGNTVKFEKRSVYPNEESIETPILTLHNDNFSGIDKIYIKTFQNGELIREDYVEYKVRGAKISGAAAAGIFSMHNNKKGISKE